MRADLATQVDLLHADGQRVVVRVSCSSGGVLISALGEAPGAEQAEDRALARLQQRLANPTAPAPVQKISSQPSLAPVAVEPAPEPASEPTPEPTPEPEDWSEELTAVEMELQRLNWDRSKEGQYLQRAFGHSSRSRLVRYGDLVAYLKALRILEPPLEPTAAALPLLRPALLKTSDELLGQLAWGAEEGRAFLVEHFSQTSRQQLSDAQLQEFNQSLQQLLLNAPSPQTA
ncbi:hypothetical protein [Synechococcus lacustris]|nr:hypothetical protein [Synechococcus lacustris]MCP9810423.1 hypothetical protein [Synechococcus lacustris Maggiore-St4-Slac]OON13189.1 MAG: hypothetical protein BTM30_00740 [Synechococcus lacustris str. Tous]